MIKKNFLNNLAKNYGTPIYVYDLNEIEKSTNKLKNSLPNYCKILYSVKANPNKEIIKKFNSMKLGMEVSSFGELKKVLDCGVDSKKIFFTGPAKTYDELKYAIYNNIGVISLESFNEIEKVTQIVKNKKILTNTVLRVNLDEKNLQSSLQMMSTSTQFGIDVEQIIKKKKYFNNLKNINLKGFHFYSASNIYKTSEILNLFKHCIKAAKKISISLNIDIQILNLGGGFACFHGQNKRLINYMKLKKELNKVLNKYFNFSDLLKIKIFFESGRYLVGNCGGLITKVIDTKVSKGEKYAILNSGINHLSGMQGIGLLKRNLFDYQILNSRKKRKKEIFNISGPLCTPLDILNKAIYNERFEVDDNIYIPNTSSYGLTASLLMFLSHDLPKEIITFKNKLLKVCKM